MFVLSTTPFSGKRVSRYTDWISTEIDFGLIAHFIVYFILGFLSSGAVRSNFNWKNKFLIILLICVLYAVTDEIHQYFEAERVARPIDVVLDSASALAGIGFYFLVYLKLINKQKYS